MKNPSKKIRRRPTVKNFLMGVAGGILIVLTVAALAGCGGGKGGGGKGGGDGDVIKMEQVYNDWDSNAAAAATKYVDKDLSIKGEVYEVNSVYVRLWKGNGSIFFSATCSDLPDDEVLELKKGDEVTISGYCYDGNDITGISLRDCYIGTTPPEAD